MKDHPDERLQWRETTLKTTLMRNHPDEKLQWRDTTLKKDHPDEKPPWWKTTVKRYQPKLKKDHPDETPPWWKTALKKDHPDETPPWWKTALKKDHPDEKPHTHSHTQVANMYKGLQTTLYIQILKHESTSTEQRKRKSFTSKWIHEYRPQESGIFWKSSRDSSCRFLQW